jgi:hypothetical protein
MAASTPRRWPRSPSIYRTRATACLSRSRSNEREPARPARTPAPVRSLASASLCPGRLRVHGREGHGLVAGKLRSMAGGFRAARQRSQAGRDARGNGAARRGGPAAATTASAAPFRHGDSHGRMPTTFHQHHATLGNRLTGWIGASGRLWCTIACVLRWRLGPGFSFCPV